MTFELIFTDKAGSQLDVLERSNDKKIVLKAVRKTLGLMETNLRHPSLQTHEYSDLDRPNGRKVFESYAQNRTPGAYRVFWHYGPKTDQITIIAIVSHP
jgi:hypothetical protein